MIRRIVPVALATLLAGCGPAVTAPSLRVRAAEARPVQLPDAEREADAAADPALAGRLATLDEAARTGDERFQEVRRGAERAVAAAGGTAAGGEAWIAAQQALSALEAARAPVRDAAGGLDDLRGDPAHAGREARTAIDAAAARIDGWNDAEARAVAALGARLG